MSGTRPASVRAAFDELGELRRRREALLAELDAVRLEMGRVLVEARAAFPWLSLTELAATAGVSRQAAYASFRRAAAREGK